MGRLEGFRGSLSERILGLKPKAAALSEPEKVAVAAPVALQTIALRARFKDGEEITEEKQETINEVERRIGLIEKSSAWRRAYRKLTGQS